MTEQSFRLVPFPAPYIPGIELTGTASLQDNILALQYSLAGNAEDVFLPLSSPNPSRKDELWKTTCFEFFLAVKNKSEYWEFNMSPSGDWNVYLMDGYRRIGFREETAISQLSFEFRKDLHSYLLDVSVDLASLIRSGQELEMAVTAIIQTSDGNETYWSITHPPLQPDFHWREGFALSLAEQIHPAPWSAAGD